MSFLNVLWYLLLVPVLVSLYNYEKDNYSLVICACAEYL